MRTTVDVDADLLLQAKRLGLEGERSLSRVIEDSLRSYLAQRAAAPARTPASFPVFEGRPGLAPGVVLEDKQALLDLLDLPDRTSGQAPHAAG